MKSKPSSGSSDGSSKAGNGKSSTRWKSNPKAAFRYFKIKNPEEVTWAAVRKKYLRLSRKHHPDRNNGSEESKIRMQKINDYYDLLKEEYERLEHEEPKQPKSPPKKPRTKNKQSTHYKGSTTGANTTRDQGNPYSTSKPPKPAYFTSEHGISHEERQRRRKLKEQERQKAKKEKKKTEKEEEKLHKEMEEQKKRDEQEYYSRQEEESQRNEEDEVERKEKKRQQEELRKGAKERKEKLSTYSLLLETVFMLASGMFALWLYFEEVDM